MAQLQGDDEQAMELYRQSMALWRQQENRNMVAWSLHDQGYLASHQGDDDRARACFSESLVLFQEWESMGGIGACLAGLAPVANSHGQALRAARLLGVVEAIGETIGGIFVPIYAAEYDRTEATTRAALDEQAFAAAWAEGRAMPLEQAIAYALEDVPDA